MPPAFRTFNILPRFQRTQTISLCTSFGVAHRTMSTFSSESSSSGIHMYVNRHFLRMPVVHRGYQSYLQGANAQSGRTRGHSTAFSLDQLTMPVSHTAQADDCTVMFPHGFLSYLLLFVSLRQSYQLQFYLNSIAADLKYCSFPFHFVSSCEERFFCFTDGVYRREEQAGTKNLTKSKFQV